MKVLFISNGHGEDLNAGLIIDALQQQAPSVSLAALPLVGIGQAYLQRHIPVIAPTQAPPSGGLVYTSAATWLKDIAGGLVTLTLKQWRALRRQQHQFDLIMAVGDSIPLMFAYLSGRPYLSLLVANSSYYEGKLRLPVTMDWWLTHRRCLGAIAKDNLTAQDLCQQRIPAGCLGYPIMDALQTSPIPLSPNSSPLIALLPGSRLPEALHNLSQLLPLCVALNQSQPMTFWGALVPAFTPSVLQQFAQKQGWQYCPDSSCLTQGNCTIHLSTQRFADILTQADLVLGMAGTAVEQAVGLGKPVLQLPGRGPQFTYAFAEAQMRLLGPSVTTIGRSPDELDLIPQATRAALKILGDSAYLQVCQQNGRERIGSAGASQVIARHILEALEDSVMIQM